MKTKKIYNLVKEVLKESKLSRNSDKELIWKVWEKQGLICSGSISEVMYDNYTCSSESITRARRAIQEEERKDKDW